MNFRTLLAVCFLAAVLAGPVKASGVYDEIIQAANNNDTARVISLLRRGMDVNTVDRQGNSLLMIAARGNNVELVRFLLGNRANPERRNPYGDTALMLAAMQGHAATVSAILERKPELNHAGWTALHYAAFSGHEDVLALLIAAGADIDLKAPNGETALMLAARNGHFQTVRVLAGARADPSVRSIEGKTALDIAREAGHREIAVFLERFGG